MKEKKMITCENCGGQFDEIKFYVDDENYSPPRTLNVCADCKKYMTQTETERKEKYGMPADAIAATLMDLIDGEYFQELWVGDMPHIRTESYRNAGIPTNDAGFVLTTGDHQYQITVVKSR
jgi:hypothetical protein